MKRVTFKTITSITAGLCLSVGAAFSYAQSEAVSLDELLRKMKNSQVAETREQRQRESQFKKERNNRSALLKKAKGEKTAQERRSQTLEKTFADQDVQIKARREQLDEKLGSLKELFGHLSSAAGDFSATAESSLVSLQYPNRGDFAKELIEKMNSETKLPTIEEIERLIYEIQRETFESGKVAKFNADVVSGEGKESMQVTRIGNYGVLGDGQYLFFEQKRGDTPSRLVKPKRQPAGLISADNAIANTSGLAPVAIDPTLPLGGEIMKIKVDRPDIKERIKQGREVGYIIIGVGVIGILLTLWRFLALTAIGGKVRAQMKAKKAKSNNPLGRVLKAAEGNVGADTETLELKLEEAVLKERPSIETGLNLIKIISMVAPLLGLLGTVTGMIQTFQAITDFGAGDPRLMAGGISAALMTTVLGLCVAIPTVFFHTILNGKAKRIIHVLEEQSAGIVAEKAEQSVGRG